MMKRIVKAMLAAVIYPFWLVANGIDDAMDRGCWITRWTYRPDGTVHYGRYKVAGKNVKRKCVVSD